MVLSCYDTQILGKRRGKKEKIREMLKETNEKQKGVLVICSSTRNYLHADVSSWTWSWLVAMVFFVYYLLLTQIICLALPFM